MFIVVTICIKIQVLLCYSAAMFKVCASYCCAVGHSHIDIGCDCRQPVVPHVGHVIIFGRREVTLMEIMDME